MAASGVTVGTSATQIISKSRSSNTARIGLLIKNTDASDTVYLGESSSTSTSSGYPLAAGGELRFDYGGGKSQFFYRGDVYGIVASGTVNVRVWEFLETR
jgi:hypothetical protein